MMTLIDVAKSCLNYPYQWGGKNPLTGLDCSGLVEWCMVSVGFDPPGFNSAQMIHDWLIGGGKALGNGQSAGALCFYGKSTNQITHVAMMINEYQIIEAGGGDSTTTSVEIAKKQGACVRIRPFGHRKDLLVIVMPNYPEWVKTV